MTRDDIKVSVLIPARDAEFTIGRAIRSIAGQSVRPYEVVVVDNGSRDGTVREAERHASGLKVKIVSCSRPGSGAARNVGIVEAAGDFIAFLDADDVWYPNKLSTQIAQVSDRSSVFSGTYMHYLSPTGRILGNNVRYKDERHASRALRMGDAMPVPLSSILVSKSLIEAAGLFNESFRRAQDFEWLNRISERAELSIPSSLPLVGYVLQPGSSSDDAYVEQGLAADAVRTAIKSQTAPDYQQHVIARMSTGKIPRKYQAGKHYRRAGALIGEHQFFRGGTELAISMAIDPLGTFAKLRWQSVGRSSENLAPEVKLLFTQQPKA
jgi:glycosyltransferase involved in cell wall biosynthesis